jgi:dimeric dUTPase (all-alpha-NTP-PPase superfamily)
MELEQLYQMQKELDARIIADKDLEGINLLPNTVLALQVEIAELANEWRGFKHWSKDQQPRRERMLEEYVDCLHFFLSIARQLDLPADDLYVGEDEVEGDTTILFSDLLHNVGLILADRLLAAEIRDIQKFRRDHLRGALFIFYGLGEQRFAFTFGQIVEAYVKKNQTNHDRQANGY